MIAYEPAFGIIGDPAKRNPTTRQSADHSMVYILSCLINNAISKKEFLTSTDNLDDFWKKLILTPYNYGEKGLNDSITRELMTKI